MNNETASRRYPLVIYIMTGIQKRHMAPFSSEKYVGLEGEYMLFAIMDGAAEIRIGSESYGLSRESLIVAEPGQAALSFTRENILSHYFITFKAFRVSDSVAQQDESPEAFPCTGALTCVPFSQCVDLLEAIEQHSSDENELMRFYNHVRFEELIRLVLQQNTRAVPASNLRDVVKSSIDYISDHYTDQMTVSQLAADANVYQWQYTRIFKELTGQIPLEFINKLRIDHAKQLLLKTEDRIHEIAQHVGFNNEFYFNRRFKKMEGIAPGRYRQHHRGKLRIVSLLMEDLLLTLGVTPIVQWSHTGWGRQEYLKLNTVPVFDVLQNSFEPLSTFNPDLIIARKSDYEYRTNQYEQCKRFVQTEIITHNDDDWHSTLRTVANRLGRVDQAELAIQQYETKVSKARGLLNRAIHNRTYAFLRVSAECISVDQTYTKPFLWGELGIVPHLMVQELTSDAGRLGVTWKWLQELDADYIFYAFDKWHEQEAGSERQQIAHPLWQTIPAVRNGHAFEVDFMTWMNHGYLANNQKIDDVLRLLVI
ncbi:AraC family transcriptional regulator [Paenibacillus sp. HWE-109]|uniref:AraC family transcriptional regulator n=1 Tax=Paenibacillus sp. HWE-109 TaxID=1306526 RepID=UPI001EDE6A0C|nr:AraC family transcriptional regulator [Paenibacillus sp. HWE-109]UKS28437.1 AraC family transcriptional regulator [Paenibacillus sp. HWE-109]